MSDSNSRPIYSTKAGRIDGVRPAPVQPRSDGIARIQRQTSGRKGEDVCLTSGIDAGSTTLNTLAAESKKRYGCGGAVKDGVIEIQGDRRGLLKSLLGAKGMRAKLVSG